MYPEVGLLPSQLVVDGNAKVVAPQSETPRGIRPSRKNVALVRENVAVGIALMFHENRELLDHM